jgi:sugar transferase (PEP-CTERM/EpsH1 system associated)
MRFSTRPIHIMHVVRTLATGGTENIVRQLLAGLDPDRFQQSVCTVVPAPDLQPPDTICLRLNADQSAFLLPRFLRVFLRTRPDIVHSRNWATIEAAMAARLARIGGIVHSEHGRDLRTAGPQPWRRSFLRRLSYAQADAVFCVSEELREHYVKQLRLPSSSFSVIPNGVDVEQFRPNPEVRSAMRAKLGVGPGTIVVGTVGRLDPIKDHLTLLRAVEIAIDRGADLRLVIVGDGSQRIVVEQALNQKAELARLTVMTGNVSNVAEWLNSFDIFVLPSLSEGMSNTVLEAMATAVASIATAVGGNCELIQHGSSGFLVQPGNPEIICNLLLGLAGNEALRREVGANARLRVISQFSIDRMLKNYDEMYCELVMPRSVRWRMPARA